MTKFKKGNKIGLGRVKGSTNTTTKNVKQAFQLLVENNLEQMTEDLKSLKPKERIDVIINLTSYFSPRMKAVEVEANVKTNDMLSELTQKIYEMNDDEIDKLCEDD